MTARGPRTPDVGRTYDSLPGGKDNYAKDRENTRRPGRGLGQPAGSCSWAASGGKQ